MTVILSIALLVILILFFKKKTHGSKVMEQEKTAQTYRKTDQQVCEDYFVYRVEKFLRWRYGRFITWDFKDKEYGLPMRSQTFQVILQYACGAMQVTVSQAAIQSRYAPTTLEWPKKPEEDAEGKADDEIIRKWISNESVALKACVEKAIKAGDCFETTYTPKEKLDPRNFKKAVALMNENVDYDLYVSDDENTIRINFQAYVEMTEVA